MRIIRIAGKKILIEVEIDLKTAELKVIPQEAYNPAHEGISRLAPTTGGTVTENDPEAFPKQRTAIPDDGDTQRDVITL